MSEAAFHTSSQRIQLARQRLQHRVRDRDLGRHAVSRRVERLAALHQRELPDDPLLRAVRRFAVGKPREDSRVRSLHVKLRALRQRLRALNRQRQLQLRVRVGKALRACRLITGVRVRVLRQCADERAVRAVAVFRMRVFFQTTERRFLRRRFVTGVGVRMFFQRADQRAGVSGSAGSSGVSPLSSCSGRMPKPRSPASSSACCLRTTQPPTFPSIVVSDAPSAETSATRATWSA